MAGSKYFVRRKGHDLRLVFGLFSHLEQQFTVARQFRSFIAPLLLFV
jgi:hypothetical protein